VQSDQAVLMAQVAQAFGPSPSVRLGIVDPVEAYLVDEALAIRLAQGLSNHEEAPAGMRVEEDPLVAAEVAEWHMDLLRAEGKIH
jgi:hypothetical protein